MQIQLDNRIVELLTRLAEKQERDVNKLVKEAVTQYLLNQQAESRFDADTKRIMEEHTWLLEQLAKS